MHTTRKQSEHAEQCIIFDWARTQQKSHPCLAFMYSTLNGVRLNMGQARKAKRSGNKRGVPDIVLPYPSGESHGLYLELKIKGNYPSKEQKEYIAYLKSVGYTAEVVYGSKAAIDCITDYLKGGQISH